MSYINYWFKAKTPHGLHSPFVYHLASEVILSRKLNNDFSNIENIRHELLRSNQEIDTTDFGTGGSKGVHVSRKIKHITENFVSSPKYCQLLFRLVNYFKPENMLELGTSLGISTIYQASASTNSRFISLEGCPNTARVAEINLDKLGLKNVGIVVGNIDDTLDEALSGFPQLDYVFIDGNHRKEPTLNYFAKCLQMAQNDSLFVLDDIHWSGDMEEAWEEIKQNPQVRVTIDLFSLGLVFFRKEQEKEHFVVRF